MITNFDKIKKLILDYEDNKLTSGVALEEINKISNTLIDKEWLDSYWNSMDLDDFVELISISPIENWNDLTEIDSLNLITEIINDVTKTAIVKRNMTALEKKYSKPDGTISDWIFHDDINDPDEILRRLKINTSIAL